MPWDRNVTVPYQNLDLLLETVQLINRSFLPGLKVLSAKLIGRAMVGADFRDIDVKAENFRHPSSSTRCYEYQMNPHTLIMVLRSNMAPGKPTARFDDDYSVWLTLPVSQRPHGPHELLDQYYPRLFRAGLFLVPGGPLHPYALCHDSDEEERVMVAFEKALQDYNVSLVQDEKGFFFYEGGGSRWEATPT